MNERNILMQVYYFTMRGSFKVRQNDMKTQKKKKILIRRLKL